MKTLNPQEFWDNLKTEESPLWPVVCVDLDGVLNVYKGWNGALEDYPKAPGAETFLTLLRVKFKTVVIFTATLPLEYAEAWLIRHDLDFYADYITNWKVPAAVYIDDKAVCFKGDFLETLKEVLEFEPHWK